MGFDRSRVRSVGRIGGCVSSTQLYRRKGLTDHRLFSVTQIQKHSSKHSKSIRVFPRLVRFEAASDLGILDLIFRQDQAGISIFRSGCFIFFKNGFFSPLRTSMISSKVWSPSHWERFPAALVYGTDTATPCDAKTLSRVWTLAWWFRKMFDICFIPAGCELPLTGSDSLERNNFLTALRNAKSYGFPFLFIGRRIIFAMPAGCW